MKNDTVFLYIIVTIALCFALVNCIQFLLKRNKTAQTVGTIISIKTVNPETTKFRNSNVGRRIEGDANNRLFF